MTPCVAPEKKLAKRLVNEGELSDDPTLEASEQPDSIAALTISAAARRGPRRAKSRIRLPFPLDDVAGRVPGEVGQGGEGLFLTAGGVGDDQPERPPSGIRRRAHGDAGCGPGRD